MIGALRIVAMAIALSASCAQHELECAPAPWDLDEVAARAVSNEDQGFTDYDIGKVQPLACTALAWSVSTDSRPLEVEGCHVVVQGLDEQQRKVWVLAAMYRHPANTPRPLWRVAWRSHDEHSGRTRLTKPPTRAEIEESIGYWESTCSSPEWRRTAGCVCAREWAAICGDTPSNAFLRQWTSRTP
jgi:hypothetical protein